MKDLALNHLKRDGKVYIVMHPRKDRTFYTPELESFFKEHGAVVKGEDILFNNLDAFHSYDQYNV